jgi:hypothetical protein
MNVEPPNPKRPIKTGIITDVSACGTLISNAAQIGATRKLSAMPITHTHAVAGRQLDWNQLPLASSLLNFKLRDCQVLSMAF